MAQAAAESASAAKDSAESANRAAKVGEATLEAAHRPYFSLQELLPKGFDSGSDQQMTLRMRNWGSVPARLTRYEIRVVVRVTNGPTESDYVERFTPKGPAVVAPSETADFNFSISLKYLYGLIEVGDVELRVMTDFVFQSLLSDTECHTFRSVHTYDVNRKAFETIESEMT